MTRGDAARRALTASVAALIFLGAFLSVRCTLQRASRALSSVEAFAVECRAMLDAHHRRLRR